MAVAILLVLLVAQVIAVQSVDVNKHLPGFDGNNRHKYHFGSCVIRQGNEKEHVISPLPVDILNVSALPTNFDWRSVNGTNLVTVSRNQHSPQYCGSCWAFAATSALGDRIKISRKGSWPEIVLAPQVLLNCLGNQSSCNGGSPSLAYEYIRTHGIPDETCAPYEAKDLPCTPENICKVCQYNLRDPTKLCTAQPTFPLYYVAEHGHVAGVDAMMAEIYSRGPIACTITVTDALENYTKGVFIDTSGIVRPDHVISVVGFGVDSTNNTPYWIIRNSWGTFWGEKGWAKIVRGKNALGIETQGCDWAVPK